jgi:hypothetical protein
MNAIPRSARLSSTGEVIGILVGSAVSSVVILAGIITLFVTVVVPGFEFGGKDQIPADFPVYPGAKLESAFASEYEDCTTVTATWSTSAPPSQVIDFYRAQLNTGPWTLTDSSRGREGFDFDFHSNSGVHREGVVTVFSRSEGGTQISLDLAKSRPPTRTSVSSCHILAGQIG